MTRTGLGRLLVVLVAAGVSAATLYWHAWRAPPNTPCPAGVSCTLPNRLKAESERTLNAGPAPWAVIRFDGRDAYLSGDAVSEREIADAAVAVDRIPGVRMVDTGGVRLVPEARPFEWSVTKSAGEVAATGAVPGREAAKMLAVELARVFGPAARNEAALRRGAPAGDWFAAAKLGIELAALLEEGRARLIDNRLELDGRVRDDATYDTINTAVAGRVPPGFAGRANLILPEAKPFVWRFERASATMSGAMTPGARARVREAGRALAGAAFRDTTALRRGAPPGDWLAATRLGIELAMQVEDGVATLTDAVLEVKGRVPDEARLAALTSALQSGLPAGYTGRAALDLPEAKPFVWRLTKAAGGASIAGAVPDPGARAALRAATQAAMSATPTDESAVRRGAPAGDWLAVARLAVALLARLEDGTATLTDGVLEIRGRARSDRIADAVTAELQRLPRGYSGQAALRLNVEEKLEGPPIEAAEACQALIDEVMTESTIEFETGSAGIRAGSRRVLDRLVKVARRCPAFRIAVEGHTDNVGDEAANQTLSERRAAAVAEFLVAAGIEKERLAAQGFGAAKPIADNATEEGRARNRRIAFAVRKAE